VAEPAKPSGGKGGESERDLIIRMIAQPRKAILYYRLLEQAVAVVPVPYKSLVKCSAGPDF